MGMNNVNRLECVWVSSRSGANWANRKKHNVFNRFPSPISSTSFKMGLDTIVSSETWKIYDVGNFKPKEYDRVYYNSFYNKSEEQKKFFLCEVGKITEKKRTERFSVKTNSVSINLKPTAEVELLKHINPIENSESNSHDDVPNKIMTMFSKQPIKPIMHIVNITMEFSPKSLKVQSSHLF